MYVPVISVLSFVLALSISPISYFFALSIWDFYVASLKVCVLFVCSEPKSVQYSIVLYLNM